MSETKKKLTFLQWLDNFWYYHKWKVVIGILLILALWAGITFYNDNLKRAEDTEDLCVMTVFSTRVTPEEIDLDERLKDGLKDIDKDGEIGVVYTAHYIADPVKTQEDKMAQAQFSNDLEHCWGDIMLFDKTSIGIYKKKDIFEPIDKYVDLTQIPEDAIVYRGDVPVAVRLTNSQIIRDMKFFTDDIYVSVMFIPEDADEKLLASRENAKIAIEKLLVQSDIEIEEEK